MARPARVTLVSSEYIGIKCSNKAELSSFKKIGFREDKIDEDLLFFDAVNSKEIFAMIEKLREMNVPFSTHRTGGADYTVETFRERGHLSGIFKRINFFGNDTDENAPFAIEEF